MLLAWSQLRVKQCDVDVEHRVITSGERDREKRTRRRKSECVFVVLFRSCSRLRADDFSYWLAQTLPHNRSKRTNKTAMDGEKERERAAVPPFLRSSRMLCRAADSPLMKNKTPYVCVFFSLCALRLLLLLVVDIVVCAYFSFIFSLSLLLFPFSPILFSRSLLLVSIITLRAHTHTHSSTSSGLFASSSSVVDVFFTTIITSET